MAANPFLQAAKDAFQRTKDDFTNSVLGAPDRAGSSPSPDSVAIGKEGGGTLAELMYAFARGGKEQLIEKVTAKFRSSSIGKEVEAEATRQAITDVIKSPTFIVTGLTIAVGIVLFVGLLIGRAR